MGDEGEDVEEVEEKTGPLSQQDLLKDYHDKRRSNKKTFKKAKEYVELIGAITSYRDMMDKYQLLFNKIPEAHLKQLDDICSAANKAARTEDTKDCFSETKPGSKKFDVVQPKVKKLDDFQLFKGHKDMFGTDLKKVVASMKGVKADIEIGPLKDLLRSVQKISEDYEAKPERLLDFIRASAICDDVASIIAFLNAFQADANFRIVRLKNGFTASAASGGYRDIKMNILYRNEIVCELQLHHRGFYELKNKGGGHKVYEVTRNFKLQGVVDAKDLMTDKTEKMKNCLDTLLALTYHSEVNKGGENSPHAMKALMDWLEYGDPEQEMAKKLDALAQALPEGTEEQKANKAKCTAYAAFFLSFYTDDDMVSKLEECIQKIASVFGQKHATTVLFRGYLIDECTKAQKFEKALSIAKEAVADFSATFGEKSIETSKVQLTLAGVYSVAEKWKDLSDLSSKLIPEFEKFAYLQAEDEDEEEDEEDEGTQGEEKKGKLPPSKELGETHLLMATAQSKLGNTDDAIAHGKKALNNFLKVYDPKYDYEDDLDEEPEDKEADDEDDDDADSYPENDNIADCCELLYQEYEKAGKFSRAAFFLSRYLSQVELEDDEEKKVQDKLKELKKKA